MFIVATIPLTNGEIWYRKLRETIEKAQMQPVWMSETKVKILTIFTLQTVWLMLSVWLSVALYINSLDWQIIIPCQIFSLQYVWFIHKRKPFAAWGESERRLLVPNEQSFELCLIPWKWHRDASRQQYVWRWRPAVTNTSAQTNSIKLWSQYKHRRQCSRNTALPSTTELPQRQTGNFNVLLVLHFLTPGDWW